MLKNALILCLSLIFSVSITAADLSVDQEIKSSQVTAELEAMTCEGEDADTAEARELNNFEPMKLAGDELASACCKVCKKGKACGNSCIARSKTCHKGRGCACDG